MSCIRRMTKEIAYCVHDARSTVIQNIWVERTTVQTDDEPIKKATLSLLFSFLTIKKKKKKNIDRFLHEEASFLICSKKMKNLDDVYQKSYISYLWWGSFRGALVDRNQNCSLHTGNCLSACIEEIWLLIDKHFKIHTYFS